MTAKEARETAFDKIGTTYEEGLNGILSHIDNEVENSANEGKLQITFCLGDLIEEYIKTKSNTLERVVGEYLKEHYEKQGFIVDIHRYNVSSDVNITLNW